jgi:glutamate--cysteine ligase
LDLPFRNGSVRDLAAQAVEIAIAGLKRRARHDANGRDESIYLAPLQAIATAGRTAAQDKLALFEGEWGGDIDRVFGAYAY